MSTHDLTQDERRLSFNASNRLGFKVNLFRDGGWICDPVSNKYKIGMGSTPEEAEADCKKENAK